MTINHLTSQLSHIMRFTRTSKTADIDPGTEGSSAAFLQQCEPGFRNFQSELRFSGNYKVTYWLPFIQTTEQGFEFSS